MKLLILSLYFSKTYFKKITKIHSVEAELLHLDRKTLGSHLLFAVLQMCLTHYKLLFTGLSTINTFTPVAILNLKSPMPAHLKTLLEIAE
jgi:hypothetical protein